MDSKTFAQSPHLLFGCAGHCFYCCYVRAHKALTPYRAGLPGSSGLRHSKGSAELSGQQQSFSACFAHSRSLCRILTVPGGFRLTLQPLCELFQTSGSLSNLAVPLVSSTFPCISCFCGYMTSLICSQQLGHVLSPQHIPTASGA